MSWSSEKAEKDTVVQFITFVATFYGIRKLK